MPKIWKIKSHAFFAPPPLIRPGAGTIIINELSGRINYITEWRVRLKGTVHRNSKNSAPRQNHLHIPLSSLISDNFIATVRQPDRTIPIPYLAITDTVI